MKFKKVSDAMALNLTQLTEWEINDPESRKHLETSRDQVMKNPLRKTMFVQGSDYRIALFVDNVANASTVSTTRTRQVSVSGKYRSIQHLAEILFAKKPALSIEQWKAAMEKEYPKSESAGVKCYGAFCVYRNSLVVNGNFRYIPIPAWFKARVS